MLEFKVITKDNKAVFKAPYEYKDNTYIFNDLSLEDTILKLKILNEKHILLIREGLTKMKIDFILDETTQMHYQNQQGCINNMTVKTTNIKVNDKNILITYDSYIDNEYLDNHKIWLLIKN